MSRLGASLAALLAFWLSAAAVADEPKTDPKADQVMTRLARFYSGLDSYKDRTEVDAAIAWGGNTIPFVLESSVTYSKPGRILIEARSEQPAGNGSLLFDGDTYWVYRADLRQYRKVKALELQGVGDEPFAANIVASILSDRDGAWPPGDDDQDLVAAVYGGKETLSGVNTDRVKLILKNGYVKLWVDAQGLVRQAATELDLGGRVSIRLKEAHEGVLLNPDISPTEFALAIPEGAIAVESFGKEPQLESSMAPASPRAEGLIANGEPAPGFSLQDLEGTTHTLADLKGKVVLLDFWATWCEPCKMEMPEIQKVHDDLKAKGLVVLGVDDEADTKAVRAFLSENGYTYPTLADPGGKIAADYRVRAIPALYIIDKDGKVAASLVGYSPERGSEIREVLKKLGVE